MDTVAAATRWLGAQQRGSKREGTSAVICVDPPVRAALSLYAARTVPIRLCRGSVCGRSSRGRCGARSRAATHSRSGPRSEHAGRRDLGSRRGVGRSRRIDSWDLCLRIDAQGTADPLLSASLDSADRGCRGQSRRHPADNPRGTGSARTVRSTWPQPAARSPPLPGEAKTFTYFEALSGSLNRGWAPLSGIVADGTEVHRPPYPRAVRPSRGSRRSAQSGRRATGGGRAPAGAAPVDGKSRRSARRRDVRGQRAAAQPRIRHVNGAQGIEAVTRIPTIPSG